MNSLTLERFAPHLNETFSATLDGTDVPFILKEAQALAAQGASTHESFGLLFHSQSPTLFAQDVYRLRHPIVGEADIFLVPVAAHDGGFVYQAIFN
jgi:hypothetical protein